MSDRELVDSVAKLASANGMSFGFSIAYDPMEQLVGVTSSRTAEQPAAARRNQESGEPLVRASYQALGWARPSLPAAGG